MSYAWSSHTKLYLDGLAFCSIGYANLTLHFLHMPVEKGKEKESRLVGFHSILSNRYSARQQRGQTSDNWSFCVIFFILLHWDTFIIPASVLAWCSNTTDIIPRRIFSLVNNRFGLKDRESPMLLGTEGQVETGEAAAAEKQLTFTNSVREAIHWGYTGAECHLLPGPNSFIKPSHKGRHT